jgi:DNA-directed RNA polymerase subunit RPC12/RpoP
MITVSLFVRLALLAGIGRRDSFDRDRRFANACLSDTRRSKTTQQAEAQVSLFKSDQSWMGFGGIISPNEERTRIYSEFLTHMINITCSRCGAVYHSEEAYVGKQLRCTKCGSVVPIVVEVARAVVQHSSSSPTIKSHTVNRSPRHRRIYSFGAAAIVVAVAAISIALLRHPGVPRQGTTLSDMKERPASQSREKVR